MLVCYANVCTMYVYTLCQVHNHDLISIRSLGLRKSETLPAFVDGQQELLSQHFVRRILRQVNLVEACGTTFSTKQQRG